MKIKIVDILAFVAVCVIGLAVVCEICRWRQDDWEDWARWKPVTPIPCSPELEALKAGQWGLGAGNDRVSAVDTDDGDLSFIYAAAGSLSQIFTSDVKLPTEATDLSVAFKAVMRSDGNGHFRPILRIPAKTGKLYFGTIQPIASIYATYSATWDKNPVGNPWTATEINELEFGLYEAPAEEERCTQLWIEVAFNGPDGFSSLTLRPSGLAGPLKATDK